MLSPTNQEAVTEEEKDSAKAATPITRADVTREGQAAPDTASRDDHYRQITRQICDNHNFSLIKLQAEKEALEKKLADAGLESSS